jgi:hypothetical protein
MCDGARGGAVAAARRIGVRVTVIELSKQLA